MFFLIGISICFFLEFILLGKRNKSLSDKILVAWLLFIGLHLVLFYLRYTQKAYNFPFVLGIDLPFPLVHGPMLFFYTSALTNQLPRRKYTLFLHLVPVLVSYAAMLPFFSLTAAERIAVFQNDGKGFELFELLNFIAIICSGIIYFVWSLLLLRKHRRNIKDVYSDTEKVSLNWLRYLIYGIGTVYLISFFMDEVYIFSAIVLFVLFIGYLGIRQVGIFTDLNQDRNRRTNQESKFLSASADTKEQKYAKSGLTDEQVDSIYQKLEELMLQEKLYRESEINLVELAGKMNLHPNQLSQVINEKAGSNFYTYINRLRINAFLKLIGEPDTKNYKLISLAYDCGFNSKSSFNKYFKTVVGSTPSEYLASRKGEN